jgi:hypothetical protein
MLSLENISLEEIKAVYADKDRQFFKQQNSQLVITTDEKGIAWARHKDHPTAIYNPELVVNNQTPYRLYQCGGKHYFSVSSVTSGGFTEFAKERWIAVIGAEYAEIITGFAAYLGTIFHRSLEWGLLGYMTDDEVARHPFSRLIKDVKALIGVELRVFSKFLGLCGTLDLSYLSHDGVVKCVDAKTIHRRYSIKEEQQHEIAAFLPRGIESQPSKMTKYRRQIAGYGLAQFESYGILPERYSIEEFSTVNFLPNSIPLFTQGGGYVKALEGLIKLRDKKFAADGIL